MFDAPMLGCGSADRVHSGDARGRRRVRRLLLRPPRRDGVELVPVGVSTFVGSGLAGEAIADHHPCSLAVLIPITVIKPGAQKRPRASIEHLGRDLIWHETEEKWPRTRVSPGQRPLRERWRRALNPRWPCAHKRFRGVLLRPLGHATARKVTGGPQAGRNRPSQVAQSGRRPVAAASRSNAGASSGTRTGGPNGPWSASSGTSNEEANSRQVRTASASGS